jgi:hypothetical protein
MVANAGVRYDARPIGKRSLQHSLVAPRADAEILRMTA